MGAFHSVNNACIDTYQNGIVTAVEVMPVTSWFPEAVKFLNENPGLDVGVHLAITSEWENVKWRPLTHCPSLIDKNGYFFPMMGPNSAYPGQSIKENNWNLSEIEQEFRAQIELTIKNIPHTSHISGHMGSLWFDASVAAMVKKLALEYNLTYLDDSVETKEKFNLYFVGYEGSNANTEKENSFLRMLDTLEPGKNYLFLDHPAYNDTEMQTVGHIGYENVAEDRQGVTELFTSEPIKRKIQEKKIELVTYNQLTKALPRSTPKIEKVDKKKITAYLNAVKENNQELHSLMIVRNGNVVYENWLGDNAANKPHIMNSVSKTFTSMAIGFAVAENRLNVHDKVISFFPDKLPEVISPELAELELFHLLTMTVGHNTDPTYTIWNTQEDWVRQFLAVPIVHKPGSRFVYNSMATYLLSAILQNVTGEKLPDYLYPRLFRPLGITGVTWLESPQGITTGGWGLYITTEDMAKMGQFILQKGQWNGKQLISSSWIEEMSGRQVPSLPAGIKQEELDVSPRDSDWLQGYGYQMWRSRHNSFRADGAGGQFILILPEKNTVIVTTAAINDMQAELNLIWKHLLPALR
ncbi:MAG: ChbG/HpnK family deacetylase [Candidatus Azobacteroides sp.]|nr:ChbG/HpnK family deacetylase [Candidatus Azobacteroides sp.]